MANTLTFHFDRNAEHCTFRGFRTHGSDAYFDMARLLTNRGWRDAPAVFVDERGMDCMTVQSIASCARRYRPTGFDLSARRARAEVRKSEAKNVSSS